MSGCFGNHPEDIAMSNELAAYENKQAEAEMREERIKAMAEDIYKEKLELLPNGRTSMYFDYTNIGDVLSELDKNVNREEMIALGAAIRDKNHWEAGRLIIKLVTGQIQYEAECEADNKVE